MSVSGDRSIDTMFSQLSLIHSQASNEQVREANNKWKINISHKFHKEITIEPVTIESLDQTVFNMESFKEKIKQNADKGLSYVLAIIWERQKVHGIARTVAFCHDAKELMQWKNTGRNQFSNPVTRKPIKTIDYYSTESAEYPIFEHLTSIRYRFKSDKHPQEDILYHKERQHFLDKYLSPDTPENLYEIGSLYFAEKGIEKNENEAFKYLKKAADQGHVKAQMKTAKCYDNGLGVEKNEREAFNYYKKAADQGNIKAQMKTAKCYDKGLGVEKNEEEAFSYYKKAADQGNIEAIFIVALSYDCGTGINNNEDLAIEYYQKAADKGDFNSLFRLASCYEKKEGFNNKQKVFFCYKKAALQENSYAKFKVAECYAKGNGVQKNEALALMNYKASADLGNISAMYEVSQIYSRGHQETKPLDTNDPLYQELKEALPPGTPQPFITGMFPENNELSFKYCKMAADINHTEACFKVAIMYSHGRGTPKDLTKSHEFLVKAAKLGHNQAKKIINIDRAENTSGEKK